MMRHVSRTHSVATDWLFDRINMDTMIEIKYVDIKFEFGDLLTKVSLTHDEWCNLRQERIQEENTEGAKPKSVCLISTSLNRGQGNPQLDSESGFCPKQSPCSKFSWSARRKNRRRWLHPRWRTSALSARSRWLLRSVARKYFPAKCHWHGSQRDPRHFFPLPDEVRSWSPQEFCTPCRAVSPHDNFPRDSWAHDEGIDDVLSIHGEINVATPILHGLETWSCLFFAFSPFDLIRVHTRCTSWHPPARGGNINTTHMKFNDCMCDFNKSLRNHSLSITVVRHRRQSTRPWSKFIFWMVSRPALQAARYEGSRIHMFTMANSSTGPWVWSSPLYSKCSNIRSCRLWSKYTNKLWTFLVWWTRTFPVLLRRLLR